MEIWYLLITGKFFFWTFRWLEIRSFLSQEVDGKMTFTGYWDVLVLNFSVMRNMVFFSAKKVYGKMIFTWSFWAFYDIAGPGKYGFSRSNCKWKKSEKNNRFWSKTQTRPECDRTPPLPHLSWHHLWTILKGGLETKLFKLAIKDI